MRALLFGLAIGGLVLVAAPTISEATCSSRCGQCLGGCCCDSFCVELGDCCRDFNAQCPVSAAVGALGCPEDGVDGDLVLSCIARAEAAACLDGPGTCPLADLVTDCAADPEGCPLPLPIAPLP